MAPSREQVSAVTDQNSTSDYRLLTTDSWLCLLLVLDVADDIADVLFTFLLLLDKGGIIESLVDLDALLALGRLGAGGFGVGLFERDEFRVRRLRRGGGFLGCRCLRPRCCGRRCRCGRSRRLAGPRAG